MERILEYFSPEDVKHGGLVRLIVASTIMMTILRWIINPQLVVFQVGYMGKGDYVSMIGMSALLIALDAMLLVLLSWNHLRDWRDALGVAALVGATHVVFPLVTFAITAGVALGTKALGLPLVLAGGTQTAIFFIAFCFVASHLLEVHEAVRKTETEGFEPDAPVATWVGVKQIWPAVFAVSIDALMVGPAKIAFMARYSQTEFLLSFLFIGATVFALVFSSGLLVLGLKTFIRNHVAISEKVHRFDWIGSLALISVFIHFSVFAAVYVLYTFMPTAEWLLSTEMIWGTTGVLCFLYGAFGHVHEIKEASRMRTGLEEAIEAAA